MSRDQLADWLHCLHGGMYDWVQEEIQKELNKPNQFYPDWDTLQPFYERIAELEKELAKPEQEPVPFPSFMRKRIEQAMEDAINPSGMSVHDGKATVLASDLHRMLLLIDSAPPRKDWVGLTNEEIDWILDLAYANDMELIKTIEAKLKEKNT
jgi:hypothetical protein